MFKKLARAIHRLAEAVEFFNETECCRSRAGLVTKADLQETENKIMAAIVTVKDYVAAVDEHLNGIGETVDGLVTATGNMSTSLTGIAGDVTDLKRQIEQINNNPGPISAEDQALITDSLAKFDALAAKVTAAKEATDVAAAAAKQLDDATEAAPTPPTA